MTRVAVQEYAAALRGLNRRGSKIKTEGGPLGEFGQTRGWYRTSASRSLHRSFGEARRHVEIICRLWGDAISSLVRPAFLWAGAT